MTATIAGGGVAGLRGVTALLRAKSTVIRQASAAVIATASWRLPPRPLLCACCPLALLVVIVFLWLAMWLIRRVVRSATIEHRLTKARRLSRGLVPAYG
jgi:hypothetical protein